MMKKNILIVVGTRPNFIKITRFKAEVQKYSNLQIKVVHTGQHYDSKMADVFFDQFELRPDYFLNIPHGSPNSQIGNIILKLEDLILNDFFPDLIIVPGDVNSTLAAAIVANKLDIKLGHLESGLRSFDTTMPEEINRIITDTLSDYYFVTEESGVVNLSEFKNNENIYFVGNTMIDSMVHYEDKIDESKILESLEVQNNNFVLLTFHRPSNVDSKEGLLKLVELITILSKNHKVVFPIHPRTIRCLKSNDLYKHIEGKKQVILTEPMGYFEFQKLVKCCRFVITDSGGIQEETTFRKVPCITVRPNTERPVTVSIGSNTLVDFNISKINVIVNEIEMGKYKISKIPKLWDGNATKRIVEKINEILI
jgi:UDP-N-acetylglucosamine 2-epimerase (non-hydrolysing)